MLCKKELSNPAMASPDPFLLMPGESFGSSQNQYRPNIRPLFTWGMGAGGFIIGGKRVMTPELTSARSLEEEASQPALQAEWQPLILVGLSASGPQKYGKWLPFWTGRA